jgi:prepilin-type N-terminal cleavage/methylation domain-containing protein
MKTGFTLTELLIVIVMLAVLFSAVWVSFNTVLETWGTQDARLGLEEDLRHGMDKVLYDLRAAKAISVADDSIRFTLYESGTNNSYIIYLYHSGDSWVPAYDQDVYELRKTALTGGINGTFTYGDGSLYIKQVKPPTTSDLSVSGNVITLDLTATRYDETVRLLEKLTARNL